MRQVAPGAGGCLGVPDLFASPLSLLLPDIFLGGGEGEVEVFSKCTRLDKHSSI
jgi:hypothetical protein